MGKYKPLLKLNINSFYSSLIADQFILAEKNALISRTLPKMQVLLKNSSLVLDTHVFKLHSGPTQLIPSNPGAWLSEWISDSSI